MKKRNRLLALGLALALAAGTIAAQFTTVSAEQPSAYAAGFANPGSEIKPKLRYWWPGAYVMENPDELVREIRSMAEAGYGGFEIADVWDSISNEDSHALDPEIYGYGTEKWNAAIKLALQTAKECGLKVDLTIGPHWPAVSNRITPNDEGAAKELAYGTAILGPGETIDGIVDEVLAPKSVTSPAMANGDEIENELIALQVVDLDEHSETVNETPWGTTVSTLDKVDFDSMEQITPLVDTATGTVTWTAPENGGQKLVVATYQRGTGQRNNMLYNNNEKEDVMSPDAYVVDHLDEQGAQLVIDFWEDTLLDDEIIQLLADVGGAIFEDSLELRTVGYWTPDMLSEFESRMGYDLTPYLPYVLGVNGASTVEASSSSIQVTSDTEETSIVARVRADFQSVMDDLYLENHIEKLTDWAHSHGLEYRAQAYGLGIDSAKAGAVADIIEGESLAFGDDGLDAFRYLAAGRDMGGNTVMSDEAGAYFGGAYSTTWKQLLSTLNKNYAVGVNQMVIHGYAYAYAPGAQWPGFAAFSPGFGGRGFAEAWGDRQPTWDNMADISSYMARTQYVLQTGANKVDIAIYESERNAQEHLQNYTDPSLGQAGYTYQFFTDGLFELDSASVSGGVLNADGPAYKAMVVRDEDCITLDVANKLLEYAKAGLPIVVIGDAPNRTVTNQVTSVATAQELYTAYEQDNAKLQTVISELLSLPNVKQIADTAELPATLRGMQVTPAANYAEASNIMSVHRADTDADYYFLYNNSDIDESLTVTLTGSGIPYELDPWTGEITPIATYQTDGSAVTLTLDIAAEDTRIIGIAQGDHFGRQPEGEHVVSTTADAVVYQNGKLVVEASQPGSYETTLSDGTVVTTEFKGEGESLDLTGLPWHLSLESWTAGDNAKTDVRDMKKTVFEQELDSLVPWTSLEAFRAVSGIGTYTTRFSLDSWDDSQGAELSLQDVCDTVHLTVNGTEIGVNQFTGKADIAKALRSGENEIIVKVASTLNNMINNSEFVDYYTTMPEQSYGVNGLAILTTCQQAALFPDQQQESSSSESSQPSSSESEQPSSSDGQSQGENNPVTGTAGVAGIAFIALLTGASFVVITRCRNKQ